MKACIEKSNIEMHLNPPHHGTSKSAPFHQMVHRSLFLASILCSAAPLILAYFIISNEEYAISLGLLSFCILVLGCGSAVKWNLLHPLVWYSLTFVLYSVAAPIRSLMGEDPYQLPTHAQALQLQYWSLVCFSLGAGLAQPATPSEESPSWKCLRQGLPLFTVLSLIIGTLYLIFIFQSGIEAKQEKVYFGAFSRVDFVFTFLTTAATIRLVDTLLLKKPRKFILTAVFYTLYFVFSFSIIGERSVVFRFLVVLAFVFHVFGKRIPLIILAAAGAALVYVSSLMGYLKGFLLSSAKLDELELMFDWESVVEFALSSEFRTAGENLAILLQYVPNSIPFFYGQALWWEIQSIFSLGLLRARDQNENAAFWFVREFFPAVYDEGSGMGFSLVAQGYLDFGYLGAMMLFLGIGVLTRFLYDKSGKNLIYFVFYVNYAPILMVACRQQVGAVVSQSLKHVLLPILLIFLIGRLRRAASN